MPHVSITLIDGDTRNIHTKEDVYDLYMDYKVDREWAEHAAAEVDRNDPAYSAAIAAGYRDPYGIGWDTKELIDTWTVERDARDVSTDDPVTSISPIVEAEDQDPDPDARDMEGWYKFMGEAKPERVYQTFLEEAPYSGLSRAGQQFQQQLGERARTQYYTSPHIREATRDTPIQTFGDFLRYGELGSTGLPRGSATLSALGGREAGATQIMNPTQMLDRLKDVGGRIMRPGYDAPDPSPYGEGGGERFLQDRMAGTTPEQQYGFVEEPLLAQTTAFPGMREAVGRMMSRRFRKQQKDTPDIPFLYWWAQNSPYWEEKA